MTDNFFDKFIKDKLNAHSSPVPEDMWSRIQAKKDKKRRGFFWWKPGTYILLLLAIAVGIGFFAIKQSEVKELPMTKNKTEKTPSLGILRENQPLQKAGTEPEVPTVAIKKDKNIITNQTGTTIKKTQRIETLEREQYSIADDKTSTIISRKNKAIRTENILSNGEKQKDITKSDFQNSKRKTITKNNLQPEVVLNPTIISQTNSNKNSDTLTQSPQDSNVVKLKEESIKAAPVLQTDTAKSLTTPAIVAGKKKDQKKKPLYFELLLSPDYTIKTAAKDINNEAFLSRKDSSETRQISFTTGFRISKSFGSHFLVKTGLQYSKINEKFSFRTENEKIQTNVIITRTLPNQAGNLITVADTSKIDQVGYRIKTTYNHYHRLDLPIILGYELANNNWKAAVNGGAIFNITSWQEGEILTPNQTYSFNKDTAGIFRKNVGVGLYLSFSYIKPIARRLDFFAEPYFRYNLSPMTNSTSAVKEKFHLAGVHFGIRFKLR